MINTTTNDSVVELRPYKRQKVGVIVKRETDGGFVYEN